MGGYVEYDVDVSRQECNCVAAFYAIKMPGKNPDGSYHYTDPFAYCDANKVGGLYCPEFDLMEANKVGFNGTAHKCDAPSAAGYYNNCDGAGQCFVKAVQ